MAIVLKVTYRTGLTQAGLSSHRFSLPLDPSRPAGRIFRLTRVFWNANTQQMHERPFTRRLLTNAQILLVSIAIEFMAPSAE